jgi:HSP20 family protein
MALVRWDPSRELETLHTDVNRVFDTFFGGRLGNGATPRWVPAMDLVETDDQLVLRADLPGLDRDDVKIEIKDGVLTVSGERRVENEERKDGYHRVERAYGGFSRSLSLPQGIDAEQVQADFDKGVLEVRIPKPAERKPHRVQIGASVDSEAQEK